mgnify:CR=1 FL=1
MLFRSAIHAALLGAGLGAGDSVVSSQDVYGASHTLLGTVMANQGVRTHFADIQDIEATQALIGRVRPKVVYAENINMARQYGASGNADAVFTAYPLVMQSQGTVVKVNAALYSPIRQSLGIVAAAKNGDAARRFADHLLRGAGHDILKSYGYSTPNR